MTEAIIINDGSKDDSSSVETRLAKKYAKVRFVDLRENAGKANALYLGFMASKGEYLLCIDGDAYIDKDCIRNMVCHFINPKNGERVGAVTGNPKIRNRSSLLSKIQICEYASIISLIKRTQRIWGKVMTVSGVCVMYRKRALLECGMWDRDMITEDIAVTWKLEKSFWDIRYEPKAVCWMLTPETIGGLAKQRRRWAQGGQEVMFRHANIFSAWALRRMIPIYIEQILSILWVIMWLLLTITELFFLLYKPSAYMNILWKSQFISLVCIVQIALALFLESKYDVNLKRNIVVAAWYPILYWIMNGLVALWAIPYTIKSVISKKKFATWTSPDRGIKTVEEEKKETDEEVFEIIDGKPEDYKEENHIIKGKQVWWKIILEWIFIIIGWVYILSYPAYVVYSIVCQAKGCIPKRILMYHNRVLPETMDLLFITLVITLVSVLVLLVWKEYNRLRFGKLNRRKFRDSVTTKDMQAYFNLTEDFLNSLRDKEISVFYENPLKDLRPDELSWLEYRKELEEKEKKKGINTTLLN